MLEKKKNNKVMVKMQRDETQIKDLPGSNLNAHSLPQE